MIHSELFWAVLSLLSFTDFKRTVFSIRVYLILALFRFPEG